MLWEMIVLYSCSVFISESDFLLSHQRQSKRVIYEDSTTEYLILCLCLCVVLGYLWDALFICRIFMAWCACSPSHNILHKTWPSVFRVIHKIIFNLKFPSALMYLWDENHMLSYYYNYFNSKFSFAMVYSLYNIVGSRYLLYILSNSWTSERIIVLLAKCSYSLISYKPFQWKMWAICGQLSRMDLRSGCHSKEHV